MLSRLLLSGLLFALFFSTQNFVIGQASEYKIPNNAFYKRLLSSTEPTVQITRYNPQIARFLPIKENKFVLYDQELLAQNHQLYIFLNASGIVYKTQFTNANSDSLIFKRIDSTDHVGYNIDCFPFFFHNSLYNIGGYGYWRWNGQLRVFSEKLKEWDIVSLNQEISIAKQSIRPVIWNDLKNSRIVALSYIQGNEAIANNKQFATHSTDSVMSLNLKTKTWLLQGSLNQILVSGLIQVRLIANLDSGLLVNNNGTIEYWNLINNRISKSKKNTNSQVLATNFLFNHFIWAEENKILFGNPSNASAIDSILLNKLDFYITNEPIYIIKNKYTTYYWSLGISLVLIGGLGFYIRNLTIKNKIQKPDSKDENLLNTSYPNKQLFNATEAELILLIIQNITNHHRYTNVDEINRVLGVGNKSIDMQKRKRSDAIISINERFALKTNRNSVMLINRIKSKLDGRLHEFYINEEELNTIRNLLN